MNRVVRRSLTAGAVALVCACTSDSATPLIGPGQIPSLEIRDGRNGGNAHFFFLAPIRPLSLRPPNTAPFNPDLSPVIDVCELTAGTCTRQISHLTMTTGGLFDRVFVSRRFEEYTALWRTDNLNLNPQKTYRISVLVGTRELGFADVDVVRTFREAKDVDREEFVPLLEDFILPIRFRIQDGALCDAGSCTSTSIDLSQGGFVVLEATGDRVDIPAQQSGQIVTVTVQQCDDLDIDLPLFGNCLRVTADPPLAARLFPRATVSMCSLDPRSLPPDHAQQDLLTLHRQDGELVQALPHVDDFCVPGLGRSDDDALPQSFAARGWRALRRAALAIFKPTTLHASTATVLDVGQGGETDLFSDFQFALPAKMTASSLVEQAASPNAAVPSVPAVLVTDALGSPVAGARVHFQITSTGGGSIAPVSGIAMSDGTGRAALTEWVVGAAGSHTVQAFGNGIADPSNNGPADGFDPFAPAVLHDPEQNAAQPPVSLSTGRLTYTATAGAPDFIIESLTQLPASPTDLNVIEWTAVVRNIGTAPGSKASVQVDLHEVVGGVPGRGIESTVLTALGALNPGESRSLRRQRTLELNGGTYQLTGTTDPRNEDPESNEENNTALTRFTVSATGLLLVRPASPIFGSPSAVDLPLTEQNGISMQSGTTIQLQVRPSGEVGWTSSDPLGTVGSVSATGLVAIIQGNEDPATAHELVVTATGAASDAIRINSFAFDHFRRFTTLVWRPVEGAATYDVQIEFGNDCTAGTAVCNLWTTHFASPATTHTLAYAFEFVGAQPGRWRVVARNQAGAIISTSKYVYFRYSI